MRSLEPSVVGQAQESVSVHEESAPVSTAAIRPWRVALSVGIFVAVTATQVGGFLASNEICDRFDHMPRFQRWLYMSPLYILGPYSAVALVLVFVLDVERRFSSKVLLHRLTLFFAISNLFASLSSSMPELLRDCEGGSAKRKVMGNLGEALWVIFYAISEVILLALVRHKVQLLTKGSSWERSSLWLGRFYFMMFVFFLLSFLPIFVWHDFKDSVYRLFAASSFTFAFGSSTLIATRTMLFAADAAETMVVAGKFPKGVRDATSMFQATYWTRWSAYATLGSMASSILLQVSLFIWMYHGYAPGTVRLVADLLGALDFVLNAMCAASLSGLVGRRTNLDLAMDSLHQVGRALIPQDEERPNSDTNA